MIISLFQYFSYFSLISMFIRVFKVGFTILVFFPAFSNFNFLPHFQSPTGAIVLIFGMPGDLTDVIIHAKFHVNWGWQSNVPHFSKWRVDRLVILTNLCTWIVRA